MSSNKHVFLFSSLGSKGPLTARKVHLRRLSDLLHLCIQRNDFQRARRIWAILARCNEVDWKALWTTGLHILSELDVGECSTQRSVEYLRTMMLHYPDDVRHKFRENRWVTIQSDISANPYSKNSCFGCSCKGNAEAL